MNNPEFQNIQDILDWLLQEVLKLVMIPSEYFSEEDHG